MECYFQFDFPGIKKMVMFSRPRIIESLLYKQNPQAYKIEISLAIASAEIDN